MKTILLVDDYVLFREAMEHIFRSHTEYQIVGQAGTAQDAITLARELHPDLVLMDYSLPDENGAEATQKIIKENPRTIVVFLTVFDSDEFLFSAIRSGAKGYLLKSLSSTEVLASLRAIERSEAAISGSMTMRILNEFSRLGPRREPAESNLATLSLRELEIVKEVAVGSTNREIASRFSISEATVKNHIHSILSKLELKSRGEVAWFAHRHGIIDPAKSGDSPSSSETSHNPNEK